MKKLSVGIVGATGYTGCELMRILVAHPYVELAYISARSCVGSHPSALFPNLFVRDFPLTYSDFSVDAIVNLCEVVFFATPHTVAMTLAPSLLARGIRVIDLSADFRLPDVATWSRYYATTHTAPQWTAQAVYGLAEYIDPRTVQQAQLIAVPGCYPTATLLGLLPFIDHQAIDRSLLVVDGKSGISGAGRKASMGLLYSELAENCMPYASAHHRHTPEIAYWLGQYGGVDRPNITFVPHLVPIVRGMEVTIYIPIRDGMSANWQDILTARYANSPFVCCVKAGDHPQTKAVRGTNSCQIAVSTTANRQHLVIMSAIDNLLKGASGQAVQLLNMLLAVPATTGLNNVAIWP